MFIDTILAELSAGQDRRCLSSQIRKVVLSRGLGYPYLAEVLRLCSDINNQRCAAKLSPVATQALTRTTNPGPSGSPTHLRPEATPASFKPGISRPAPTSFSRCRRLPRRRSAPSRCCHLPIYARPFPHPSGQPHLPMTLRASTGSWCRCAWRYASPRVS
jgi:hypothetical protein